MKRFLSILILLMIFLGAFMPFSPTETELGVFAQNDLQAQIKAHIEAYEQEPQEPRICPVWEFVPGLYGIEYDFEMSYQNMLAHGTFNPQLMIGRAIPFSESNDDFRTHRIYRGHENSPYVGLLINVAWGEIEFLDILNVLDEYDVVASVFFEGKFANEHPEIVKETFARGHLVGNHSYSHPADWMAIGYDGFTREIVQTNDILANIIGEPIRYFAPPGGAFTNNTLKAAYDQGMYTILWSADSIDWKGEPADVLVERVMRRITPGGLILTHPKQETVKALPTIINNIRQEGYEFRRVDDIVNGTRLDGIH